MGVVTAQVCEALGPAAGVAEHQRAVRIGGHPEALGRTREHHLVHAPLNQRREHACDVEVDVRRRSGGAAQNGHVVGADDLDRVAVAQEVGSHDREQAAPYHPPAGAHVEPEVLHHVKQQHIAATSLLQKGLLGEAAVLAAAEGDGDIVASLRTPEPAEQPRATGVIAFGVVDRTSEGDPGQPEVGRPEVEGDPAHGLSEDHLHLLCHRAPHAQLQTQQHVIQQTAVHAPQGDPVVVDVPVVAPLERVLGALVPREGHPAPPDLGRVYHDDDKRGLPGDVNHLPTHQ